MPPRAENKKALIPDLSHNRNELVTWRVSFTTADRLTQSSQYSGRLKGGQTFILPVSGRCQRVTWWKPGKVAEHLVDRGHWPWQDATSRGFGAMMLYIVVTMDIKVELADTEENVQEATWSSLRALHTPRAKLINAGSEKDRESQGSG